MHTLVLASTLLAFAWGLAALVTLRTQRRAALSLVGACALLAGTHGLAAAWPQGAPLVIAAWIGYALVLPTGRLHGVARVLIAGITGFGLAGWTVSLAASRNTPNVQTYVVVAGAASVLGAIVSVLRFRNSTAEEHRVLQWLAAACITATGWAIACLTLHLMTDDPRALAVWVAIGLLAVPIGQILSVTVTSDGAPAGVLVEAIAAVGVTALIAVSYLVIVVGIGGSPHGHERSVLFASLVAAMVVALLVMPVRRRVLRVAESFVGGSETSASEVVTTFGARMSRAVPMDELMLQLVESLRATLAPSGAEIWTGPDGVLTRAVSVPSLPADRIQLAERERLVVGRARIGGPAWTAVWLPQLFDAPGDRIGDHRVVPIAHLGDLLGLIIVRRPADIAPFDDGDEQALVELARQLGLALHNVRLDSALQASLAELAERNEQLQASRLRIVTASDSSRRAIERNLHDGAQQHLVALAVKLGLARQIAEEGDTESVLELLADLRGDVQTTIGELRELAHGIYPPLLRDRGLGEALRTAATRAAMPCTIDVDLADRYPEEVETAAYFCCLEAMQNAGKYAGDGASIAVHVSGDTDTLQFELADDGAGFDMATTVLGNGFMNMQDRLGAIGGVLTVESSPGAGTAVRARIPARPISKEEPEAPAAQHGAAALRSSV